MIRELDLAWSRLDRSRPPVVLLGGINVLRSLGVAGLPVIVASSDRLEPAFASRYCSGRCDLPPFESAAAALAVLLSLGEALKRRFGVRVPLMYGSDEALEWINDFRDSLRPWFLFLMSDRYVADALIAKDRFQAFAELCKLPVPRALAWEGHGPGSLTGAHGKVVVKPKLKLDWHRSEIFHRLFGGAGKARVFSSAEEALRHPLVRRFCHQLHFQEYIPGTDRDSWSFHGFADERGELLASFIGRKVRTYPVQMGESAFIELAHDDELGALGEQIARQCPLRGAFKMDFKRDPRDGRWYLLEINARFSLWHYLGAVNGINLPAAAYRYLLFSERPQAAGHADGVRWLSWRLDLKAYRALAARKELTLWAWLRSLAGSRKVYSIFAWKDPDPWLFLQVQRVLRRWRRGPARLLGTLRQWLLSAS